MEWKCIKCKTGRTQQDRQEEEWSIPTNVERRENDTESHESPRVLPPPAPPPREDRLFTDWSIIDSPRERTSLHNVTARNIEPNINQTDNQADQPRSESARNEAMGNTLSDVMTFPSACRQSSQVGTRLIDRETNTSEVEVRTQREETRIDNPSSNNRDTQMPTSHSGLSSQDTEIIGGSTIRTHTTDMIPQLDGPTSFCTKRRLSENTRIEQDTIQRTTVIPRGGYPDESDSNSDDNRRPHNGRRPSGRRRYQDRSGKPLDRRNNHNRGYSRRGRPPDDGGPLMMEDPLEMDRNPRCPGRQGPPGPPGPPGPVMAYYSTAAPGHFRYYSSGKYFWNSQPVYVTIG